MTDIEKNLVKIDLCGRLPYNVKVHAKYTDIGETIELDGIVKMIDDDGVVGIEVINDFSSAWTYAQIDNIKPYLFPLSSMTDKELIEFLRIKGMNLDSYGLKTFRNGETVIVSTLPLYSRHVDWLNAHHFDYRGLIPMGLANDATGLNIY